jgi:hypothetical protein
MLASIRLRRTSKLPSLLNSRMSPVQNVAQQLAAPPSLSWMLRPIR